MRSRYALLQLAACTLFLLVCSAKPTTASHWTGANYTMECLNPCTTRIYLRTYRDCGGATAVNANFDFDTLSPGCVLPIVASPISSEIRTEISPVCPSTPTTCSNPPGNIYGTEEIMRYRDFAICGLGTNCSYELRYYTCCRNGAITSGSGNEAGSILNLVDFSQGCNNSPVFAGTPLTRLCNGQPMTLHQGAIDPDGDSLVYSMGACLGGGTGFDTLTYATGYSPSSPLGATWDFDLDSATGLLTVTPNPGSIQIAPVCIKTEEFRNGNLIGTSFRDLHVIVFPCSANIQPAYSAIANLPPNATQIGTDTIGWCGTSQLCFDIGVSDPDTSAGQMVTLYWDGGIPGATFSEAGNALVQDTITGNSPVGRFCWTPPGPGSYNFILTARDDACPFYSQNDRMITIMVGGSPPPPVSITAIGTLDTCNGTTVTLDAGGGYSSYLWSNSATTQTITVGLAGTYSVTAQTGAFCSATGSYTVLNQPVPQITGTLFTSAATSLTNTKVYLIRHDVSTNALIAEDSTYTDAFGNYSFCGVALDTMYLKATPDSAAYPTEMPTYADTSAWWNGAEMVLASSFPVVKSFQTRFGSNPGGPGFIGGLISQGANKTAAPGDPMPGVTVILYNRTLGQFIGHTKSDGNGYFSFGSLPLGNYEVSVDVPGVDHVIVPSLVLDGATSVQDSLDFRLHTTYFELVVPTSIQSAGMNGLNLQAFPNPAGETMNVSLELPQEGKICLELLDLQGRQLAVIAEQTLDPGTYRWRLDLEGLKLPSGMYFLSLRGDGYKRVVKVLLN